MPTERLALTRALAISALRKYPTRIKSYEEAVAIRGIGDKTARKVRCTRGLRAALHAPSADHGNRRNGEPPADRARADRGRRVCAGVPGRVWRRSVLLDTRPILFAEQPVNMHAISP